MVSKQERLIHRKEIARLLSELTSGDDRRAEAAVRMLPVYGSSALPALKELLSSPVVDTRWWAIWALTGIPDLEVLPLLRNGLHDPALEVRQAAALSLRERPHPEAIPGLIALLGDEDHILAHLAAAALIAIGKDAVPSLMKVMEGGPHPARLVAARALATIGDQRAIPALFEVLDSESTLLEYWASEGLERMGVGMSFIKPE